jgi:methionine aminopeptidase
MSGVNLLELDELAHQMIRDRGAESCYINYHPSFGASPFGKVLCTSVNDAVLHGLPHDYELRDGDLVSLDFAASVNGWVADSAISVIVGSPREQDQQLIATAEAALAAGIEAALPGTRSGTSPSPSPASGRRRATRSTPSSGDTAWAVRCTEILTYPTMVGGAAACCSGRGW